MLHPSWQAKRQQQVKLSIPTTLQPAAASKKVIFTESGDVLQPRSKEPTAVAHGRAGSSNSSRPPAPPGATSAGLHPSWEAKKRKEKEMAALASRPSGKKTKFED